MGVLGLGSQRWSNVAKGHAETIGSESLPAVGAGATKAKFPAQPMRPLPHGYGNALSQWRMRLTRVPLVARAYPTLLRGLYLPHRNSVNPHVSPAKLITFRTASLSEISDNGVGMPIFGLFVPEFCSDVPANASALPDFCP